MSVRSKRCKGNWAHDVNLSRGTWHHPLLALDAGGDFLVIDRGAPDASEDCDVHRLDQTEVWIER